MAWKVSEIADKAKMADNWNDSRIDRALGAGEMMDPRTVGNVRNMIDKEFNGNGPAAVDFMLKHGKDPRVADRDFNDFVESGDAHRMIQSVRNPAPAKQNVQVAKAGTAVPQEEPASTTTPAKNDSAKAEAQKPKMTQAEIPGGIEEVVVTARKPSEQDIKIAQIDDLIAQGFGVVGIMDFLGKDSPLLDQYGRLDLNGDGVGGVAGFIQAMQQFVDRFAEDPGVRICNGMGNEPLLPQLARLTPMDPKTGNEIDGRTPGINGNPGPNVPDYTNVLQNNGLKMG